MILATKEEEEENEEKEEREEEEKEEEKEEGKEEEEEEEKGGERIDAINETRFTTYQVIESTECRRLLYSASLALWGRNEVKKDVINE